MSERNLTLLLLDIKVSIGKILTYTEGMNFESYEADSRTKDAVERNFEIIGEAASRIPDDFKKFAARDFKIDFSNRINSRDLRRSTNPYI
jgi:uncharacterized protein with HEPN domain